jgi:hypothetical protein
MRRIFSVVAFISLFTVPGVTGATVDTGASHSGKRRGFHATERNQ